MVSSSALWHEESFASSYVCALEFGMRVNRSSHQADAAAHSRVVPPGREDACKHVQHRSQTSPRTFSEPETREIETLMSTDTTICAHDNRKLKEDSTSLLQPASAPCLFRPFEFAGLTPEGIGVATEERCVGRMWPTKSVLRKSRIAEYPVHPLAGAAVQGNPLDRGPKNRCARRATKRKAKSVMQSLRCAPVWLFADTSFCADALKPKLLRDALA